MRAGTRLRTKTKRGDALAVLAVGKIKAQRTTPDVGRQCTILRSLKTPMEVQTLREVYGDRFVAIGLHAPREERHQNLARKLAESAGGRADDHLAEAEQLIAIDQREAGTKFGQRVRDTFPLADYFVTTTRELDPQLERLVHLFFGKPVVTPTRDEHGMFHADAASRRSAAMGRQVGAAIANRDGDVIVVGCNEAPKAGGGQYWEGDVPDGRDFQRGHDESDRSKASVLRDLLRRLGERGMLAKNVDPTRLTTAMLRGEAGELLAEATVLQLTEFTRDVHAESAALMTAARLGRAVRRAVLYVTTFPCHNCAKHIVSAGIQRVVFIEPYAKSYAHEFYPEAVSVERIDPLRTSFVPFQGAAPRRYMEWFRMVGDRKDKSGRVARWVPAEAMPLFAGGGSEPRLDPTHVQREDVLLKGFKAVLVEARLPATSAKRPATLATRRRRS